ncbi:hypothetical protein ADEAN_000679900 [Angomonas deanei]|uniref:Uncharacterized protein n=1 Tax=Angomonas deanei TaxID=59799 RepID=A0A7G2CK71_9TRYP|nr:hypothetical protein ADEAN_000679900 [Angomonas deanei]
MEEARRRKNEEKEREEAYLAHLRDFQTFRNANTVVKPFDLTPLGYRGNRRMQRAKKKKEVSGFADDSNYHHNNENSMFEELGPRIREDLLFSQKMDSKLNKNTSRLEDLL